MQHKRNVSNSHEPNTRTSYTHLNQIGIEMEWNVFFGCSAFGAGIVRVAVLKGDFKKADDWRIPMPQCCHNTNSIGFNYFIHSG